MILGAQGRNELQWKIFGKKTEERKVIWKDSIFADDLVRGKGGKNQDLTPLFRAIIALAVK